MYEVDYSTVCIGLLLKFLLVISAMQTYLVTEEAWSDVLLDESPPPSLFPQIRQLTGSVILGLCGVFFLV